MSAVLACEDHQTSLDDFGDQLLRQLLTAQVADLEEYFGVRYKSVCMDEDYFGAYVDGSHLVMGTSFIEDLGSRNFNRIAAVLAHETAHRFQIHHRLLGNLMPPTSGQVKCIELHADFMAGGYMRQRSENVTTEADDLAEMFFGLGDDATGSLDHHGRHPERFLAFSWGFATLFDSAYSNSTLGMVYVSGIDCEP